MEESIETASSTTIGSTTTASSTTSSQTSTTIQPDHWKRQRTTSDQIPVESSPTSPAVISRHSSQSELSTKPKPEPRPAVCEDFLFRFRRQPTNFTLFIIPEDVSVSFACRLLKTDPYVPNLISISTVDYHPTADLNSPIFAEWVALTTPSGLVFAINLKKHGLPSEIKDLLMSNAYFVGFEFSKALGNTDETFRGIKVDFDVADCLGK